MSSSSTQKFLYINHEDEEATGKIAFIENETTAALVERALALGEISPFLPFAYKALVSVDGDKTFSNSANTKITERPKNGDVTLRIQKKAARLYLHILDKNTTKDNIEKNFDEPKETISIKFSDEQVARHEKSGKIGVSREMILAEASKAATAAQQKSTTTITPSSLHVLYARSSPDGAFHQLKEGTSAAFPFFPFNGDVFAVPPAATDIVTDDMIKKAYAQAEALLKKQRFAAAAEIFQGIIDMFPNKDDKLSPDALPLWHQLGAIFSEKGARTPEKAIEPLRNCLKIARKLPSGKESGKQAVTYASNLAKELFNNKQYREAANMFQEAFDMVRGEVTLSSDVTREMRIRMGAALYMGGAKPQGMQLVQEAVAGDTTNTLGVYWMSKFYAEMDHDDDALQWASTLLLNKSENPEFRKNFAEIVSGIPDSIDILKNKIITGNTPKHAQVWCFLGLVLSDAGFLNLAKQFYEKGIELDPENASYALNYAHVLEHLNQLNKGLTHIVKFLQRKGDVKLGMNKAFSPTPAAVARAIRGLSPVALPDVGAAAADDVEEAKKERQQLVEKQLAEALPTLIATPSFPSTSAIRFKKHEKNEELNDFHHIQFYENIKDAENVPAIAQEARGESKGDSRPAKNALFGEEDLNIAGLYFTAVKFMFVIGCLDRLPYLISLINPLRLHQQFHETKMKNEHSYYSTIASAVQFLTVPKSAIPSSPYEHLLEQQKQQKEGDPIMTLSTWMSVHSRCVYYVGDSHSVPVGWHFVEDKKINKPVLIVNKLVTGLKIWHLREEGSFYPKKQFEAVTASLPQSSTVIFNFGEIDCREAVLRVVDRGLYKNAEQCFEYLAKVYIQAVLDIKRLRRLSKILVVGPLPTLDATRHLVVACNKVFARMFANSSDIKNGAHRITFVDVCDQVLTTKEQDPLGTRAEFVAKAGEPRVLKSEFHFDRTHIHPCFVSKVLEPVLNETIF